MTNRETTVTVFTEIAAVQYTPQIAMLKFKRSLYTSVFKPHLGSVSSGAVRTVSQMPAALNVILIRFGQYTVLGPSLLTSCGKSTNWKLFGFMD